MVTLPGLVNRNAKPQYDQGPVEPSLQFGYVPLIIGPSPSQKTALDQLLAQQQDRSSPNCRKWLTPEQYADRFGLSQNDVNKMTSWLKSQGFIVLSVPRGRNSVIFSGTAAQIQSAFNTEIHRYDVNGEKHIANSIPLSVPAALSGIVTAVRGLTDFLPKPMYVRPARGGKIPSLHPSYTTSIEGTTEYVLAPGHIATIYEIRCTTHHR
jgi:subtilase family serine protease